MKNATAYGKKLKKLIAELRADYELPELEPMAPMPTLVFAFLAEDATTAEAEVAYDSIMTQVIDFNDLRVTDVMDIIHMLGHDYPFVVSRTQAMTTCLLSIYDKEHGTNLDRLPDANKRDAKAYLEKLDGITPFVVSSVMLSLGAHAVPTDQQLVNILTADEVVAPDSALDVVNSFLESQIKAADSLESYYLLRGYLDDAEPARKELTASALEAASLEKVEKIDLLGKSKATTKTSEPVKPVLRKKTTKKKKTSKKATSAE